MEETQLDYTSPTPITVCLRSNRVQQPEPGRGLSFKDLAPELLAMIFGDCNLVSPLNDDQIFTIPPLIIALCPQVAQYHQALALLYQQSYVYAPYYATKAFMAKFKNTRPLIRKIAISIKTILRRDNTTYFLPYPESIKGMLEGASITYVNISLDLRGEDNPPDTAQARFIYDFPKWLAGFRNLTYVEASLPRSACVFFNSAQRDKYDDIIETRSDHLTSKSGLLERDILIWVAKPGKTMDWSKVARHLQSLGESYEPTMRPSEIVF